MFARLKRLRDGQGFLDHKENLASKEANLRPLGFPAAKRRCINTRGPTFAGHQRLPTPMASQRAALPPLAPFVSSCLPSALPSPPSLPSRLDRGGVPRAAASAATSAAHTATLAADRSVIQAAAPTAHTRQPLIAALAAPEARAQYDARVTERVRAAVLERVEREEREAREREAARQAAEHAKLARRMERVSALTTRIREASPQRASLEATTATLHSEWEALGDRAAELGLSLTEAEDGHKRLEAALAAAAAASPAIEGHCGGGGGLMASLSSFLGGAPSSAASAASASSSAARPSGASLAALADEVDAHLEAASDDGASLSRSIDAALKRSSALGRQLVAILWKRRDAEAGAVAEGAAVAEGGGMGDETEDEEEWMQLHAPDDHQAWSAVQQRCTATSEGLRALDESVASTLSRAAALETPLRQLGTQARAIAAKELRAAVPSPPGCVQFSLQAPLRQPVP